MVDSQDFVEEDQKNGSDLLVNNGNPEDGSDDDAQVNQPSSFYS